MIQTIVSTSFCTIRSGLSLKNDGVNDLIFVKERRHTAQLLTIVLRDFANILTGGKKVSTLAGTLGQIWLLCLQNLTYLLPFYVQRVLSPSDDLLGIEDQDIEFQGCIAQIYNLLSTTASLHPQKQFYTENIETVLYILVAYCLLGDETERLLEKD